MSFKDILKKSVLKAFDTGGLTAADMLLALAMATALGLLIYLIYRVSSRSGFYNRSFNKSLATLPVITCGIMLAMQNNLVISLGMVGALSIVRFRNAVKDSVDLTFLFWSISVGIIVGTGLFSLGLILSLVMTVLLFGLDLLPSGRAPYLLVISGSEETNEEALKQQIQQFAPRYKVRSRSQSHRGMEWIVELRVKEPARLMEALRQDKTLSSVNLLSHDGDVRY